LKVESWADKKVDAMVALLADKSVHKWDVSTVLLLDAKMVGRLVVVMVVWLVVMMAEQLVSQKAEQ